MEKDNIEAKEGPSSSSSDEDEDEVDGDLPGPSNDTVQSEALKFQAKNKRKRTDVRRRIRKILKPEQLDADTVSAQKEEEERLRRLELQKSLNAFPPAHFAVIHEQPAEKGGTPPLLSDSPLNGCSTLPLLVEIAETKSQSDSVIIIDDSDEECGVLETSSIGRSASEPIIEISDSEDESEDDGADNVSEDVEPETSGSHTNDDVNQPDAQGMVLVNVNHPPTEPNIFLSTYMSSCVKPHQIGGIRFLYDNLVESLSRYQVSPGFGCILAHSMGLGKTLQLICFIDIFLSYTKATKVLCIVPMNTIQNWYSEFNTWLPEESADEKMDVDESSEETDQSEKPTSFRQFKVLLLSDGVRTTVARAALISEWHRDGGVLLMGYEMYRILALYTPSLVNNTKLSASKRKKPTNSSTKEVIDLDEEEKNMDLLLGIQRSLCKPGPDLVVCDEGHRIKNNQANVSQALKKIQTRRRVVLTGYPLQNNLMEYWCMVDFVRPNFLGTRHEFSNMFERPIVNGQCVDSTASDIKLMRFRAHVLHNLLEGFVQRRSEAVLTKTLPEKEEHVIPVKMSAIQLSLYKTFVSSVKNYLGYVNPIKAFSICIKIWNHPDILKTYLDRKKDGSRNNSPLTVQGDPDLDIGENVSKKVRETKAQSQENPMREAKTSFTSTEWVGQLLDNYEYGVMENGAKMVILSEIIEKTVSLGDRILVFSQSLSTLSMIEDCLRKRLVPPLPSQLMFEPVNWERNKNYYRLDGSTSSQEREKLIRAFNSKNNKSVFLFLLSTRACSLGVNLIGANRVVVFDASWNPCHDAQAVCRVYRYGQTKKCYIYRLVSFETFEKRMYERQITKEGMSDRVIDELNPDANLTKQEVLKLFNDKDTEAQEKQDLLSVTEKFSDLVLNHVYETLKKSLFKVPYKHKIQNTTKSAKTTLTKAEKREAKKGYEREKRAINSANRVVEPSSETMSAMIRERMRREAVVNRPIGHVKPIQNIRPSLAQQQPTVPLPPVLSLAGNQPFLNTMPSMSYFQSLTFPPMPYARYVPPGELRTFPPYSMKQSPTVHFTNVPPLPLNNPILVNLVTSPESEQSPGISELQNPNPHTRTDDAISLKITAPMITEVSSAIEPDVLHGSQADVTDLENSATPMDNRICLPGAAEIPGPSSSTQSRSPSQDTRTIDEPLAEAEMNVG